MKNYLRYNSLSALLLRIAEVISGFILPYFILSYYGSATNGLVNSVSQFLGVIAFFDMGTTAVVTSTLYRPIAEKNQEKINQIVSAARGFFRKIAYVLIAYVILLCIFFPILSDDPFGWVFTTVLIIAMAIQSFAQYYTGITDQIFLSANQREYIYSVTCAITILINTVCSVLLIILGAEIWAVRLATSIIYLIRPAVMRLYIKKNYSLNRKVKYDHDTIPQRWNGVAQHIAFRILTGTDTIVLTIFSTLESVSVYSVYNMVTDGVYLLIHSLTNGLKARLGNLWAQGKYEQVRSEYMWHEWRYHLIITFVFGCTMSLLMPFVIAYTSGMEDVNYQWPVFAVIITSAYAVLAMAQFDVIIVQAVNHYKQTQVYYIISAVINVVISVVLVVRFGLVGVSIGTLVAMLFQYGWTQWYMSKKIFHVGIFPAVKQIFSDFCIIFVGYFLCSFWISDDYTYLSWLLLAIRVAIVFFVITFLINLVLYRRNTLTLIKNVGRRIHIIK